MDIEALIARKRADRASRGLIAANGRACATIAERDYINLREQLKTRDDWGALPAHLETQLETARARYMTRGAKA